MRRVIVAMVIVVVLAASGVGLVLARDAIRGTPPGPTSERVEAGTSTSSSTSSTVATLQTPPGPPPPAVPVCRFADEPVVQDPLTDWATVVIDTATRLPAEFTPPDLVGVSAAGFGPSDDMVRALVIPELGALRAAAEANGTPFRVVSGFRSFAYQEGLFNGRAAELGIAEATALTARPGHSEHQLGTTVDVLDPGAVELTQAFGDTPAGRWIAAHAHEYGFVLSYPPEGRDKTCYDYEPWHLRFVGRDVADQIHASGLTSREWLLTQELASG